MNIGALVKILKKDRKAVMTTNINMYSLTESEIIYNIQYMPFLIASAFRHVWEAECIEDLNLAEFCIDSQLKSFKGNTHENWKVMVPTHMRDKDYFQGFNHLWRRATWKEYEAIQIFQYLCIYCDTGDCSFLEKSLEHLNTLIRKWEK